MNLQSDSALRAVIDKIQATAKSSPQSQKWSQKTADYIREIDEAKASGFRQPDSLRRLFDVDILSATGQGNLSLQAAYDDEDFKQRIARIASIGLPTDKDQRVAQLVTVYDELLEVMRNLCGRAPRLKLNRALAVLFPADFTTLADVGKLKELNRMLGGSPKDHPVQAHRNILDRLAGVLGAVMPGNIDDLATRLNLAWHVYVEAIKSDDPTAVSESSSSSGDLLPLPASRRRKGLLAIAGYLPTILDYLEELREGLTRAELFDAIRADNPKLKDSSIATVVNSMHKEFDLIKKDGDKFVLSARGINLLENGDPDELEDFLLTRVLGVDHLLVALRDTPRTKSDLYAILQRANPGWTSNFAPGAMVNWLLALGVLEKTDTGSLTLSVRGKRWAEKVTWTPENLPPPLEGPLEVEEKSPPSEYRCIRLDDLLRWLDGQMNASCIFPKKAVTELHTALWAHPRRHFAVLAGISGSGKTQMARTYGLALCGGDESRVLIVPVQPGWFEPSALLGYLNPLEQQYNSTPFLALLQRAADDPASPYVVILDEMNLSHPEQYLAPILSAMETGSKINIHQMADTSIDVMPEIPYPSNLAIIGTVNMDETTHGLSDKVLDRAYTMEFWDIDVEQFPHWNHKQLDENERKSLRSLLTAISKELAPLRLHFGWRTIDDVVRYIVFSKENGMPFLDALDSVLYAKVLPKIRGEDSVRFRAALQNVRSILKDLPLDRCERKISELLNDLQESGTARFWR